MTNTANLIERLNRWPLPDCPLPSEALADMRDAAEALSILTRPPLALSDEQYAEFLRALDEPPPPDEKLVSMMVRYRLAKAASAARPLPEEIAGLIGRLRSWTGENNQATYQMMGKAAVTLEQMARENERLKGELSYMTDEVTPANLACIRELEAAAKAPLPEEIAEGIERLKRAASHASDMPYVEGQCLWAAAALEQMARALNQPAES